MGLQQRSPDLRHRPLRAAVMVLINTDAIFRRGCGIIVPLRTTVGGHFSSISGRIVAATLAAWVSAQHAVMDLMLVLLILVGLTS
jgi:hypothetical protein